ncbi:hypothetical protein [Ochrobactrum sp. MYb379]|uniref:hypothetical protein n=1 Tax=Ochrobactrum sp. MYb379 TaxID=2745275 RepID=UPI0030B52F96
MTHRPILPQEQMVNNAASRLKSDTRQADWRRANPKKYAAHIAVQRALNQGKIAKRPCEVCGEPRVDAHHDDYSQALKVRWLCRSHHNRLHAGGDDMFKTKPAKGASS